MRILLVDDHPIFLEGMKNLLRARGVEVADTASDGEEAVEKTARILPDVVLMDIRLKRLSGLQAAKQIKERFPKVKIVMLTASESEKDLWEAVRSGASGYLLKNLDAGELCRLLEQYGQGEIPVSPGFAVRLLEEFKRNDRGHGQDKLPERTTAEDKKTLLSEKQRELLVLVAKGVKYKDIAVSQGISERMVKHHMEGILKKLHMENRSQAIKYIIEEGIED